MPIPVNGASLEDSARRRIGHFLPRSELLTRVSVANVLALAAECVLRRTRRRNLACCRTSRPGPFRSTRSGVPLSFRDLPGSRRGLFSLGTALAFWSGFKLIHRGNGTPFPLDPTRRLVTSGPYRVVRNPQGIALMLLTCGEALVLDAPLLWLLPLLAGLFLIGVAEPFEDWEMQRRFGRRYARYCSRVRRWLPRYFARSHHHRVA